MRNPWKKNHEDITMEALKTIFEINLKQPASGGVSKG